MVEQWHMKSKPASSCISAMSQASGAFHWQCIPNRGGLSYRHLIAKRLVVHGEAKTAGLRTATRRPVCPGPRRKASQATDEVGVGKIPRAQSDLELVVAVAVASTAAAAVTAMPQHAALDEFLDAPRRRSASLAGACTDRDGCNQSKKAKQQNHPHHPLRRPRPPRRLQHRHSSPPPTFAAPAGVDATTLAALHAHDFRTATPVQGHHPRLLRHQDVAVQATGSGRRWRSSCCSSSCCAGADALRCTRPARP